MRCAGTRMGRGVQLLMLLGLMLVSLAVAGMPAPANAQFFDGILRPPGSVPTAPQPPAAAPAAPAPPPAAAAPKGPALQSLPSTPAQLHSAPAGAGSAPVVPPGQGALS